jgi:MarR family transcriptional regulator, 2-MHQ and catechol-resistance regulon repressor
VATKHRGTDTERRALDAYIKLSRATAAVDARINRPLARVELTASQFGVLEALWHLGPLSHGDIGRKLLKSSGNVTVVIDNLARRGLVSRERDPADRRVSRVALTSDGRRLLERVFPCHVQRVVDAFDELTREDLETLSYLLRRLGRRAEAAATPIHPTAARAGPEPHPPQEDIP